MSHKPSDATKEDSQKETPPPQFERRTLPQQKRKPHTTTKEEAPIPQLESVLLHITTRKSTPFHHNQTGVTSSQFEKSTLTQLKRNPSTTSKEEHHCHSWRGVCRQLEGSQCMENKEWALTVIRVEPHAATRE